MNDIDFYYKYGGKNRYKSPSNLINGSRKKCIYAECDKFAYKEMACLKHFEIIMRNKNPTIIYSKAKFSLEQAREIRKYFNENKSSNAISYLCDKYKVRRKVISDIVNNRTYKELEA